MVGVAVVSGLAAGGASAEPLAGDQYILTLPGVERVTDGQSQRRLPEIDPADRAGVLGESEPTPTSASAIEAGLGNPAFIATAIGTLLLLALLARRPRR